MALLYCYMENLAAHSVVVMLPPNSCIPRNYSCMAGLFGSLAAASHRKEDGEEDSEPRPRARLEIARSRSPTSQKKVRFADSLGLELTSVKHFCDADMPEVPQRILDKFKRGNAMHLNNFPKITNQPACMETQFVNPGQLPGFMEKVQEVKVLLESVETDEFSMSGVVRVLNLAFEKSVLLRYTLNNWLTFFDVQASYVPRSSDGATDKFSFKIITPAFLETGGTLQFAIKYTVGGNEFWDNNKGNNYKVRRHRFKISPPREWENGWIHFI
uniref:CBM21 domain-containing protein n=1 Tax=Paramormyrops kingsleyae TaxID=1676925 RepID=A0A3B3R5R1_9TELE